MESTKITLRLPDIVRQQLKLVPYGKKTTSHLITVAKRYASVIEAEKKQIKTIFAQPELEIIINCNKSLQETEVVFPFEQIKCNYLKDYSEDQTYKKLLQLTEAEQFALISIIEESN